MKKEVISYNVGGISIDSLKTAKVYARNLSNEVTTEFVNENCSPFAFCKWLLKKRSNSCVWFVTSVLGLDLENAKPETILTALVARYPIVNTDNKMCKKVTICKGIFKLVPISVFDSSVLNACIESYLRNTKQIQLPDFGKIEENGNISEISESKAQEFEDSAKDQRRAKKEASTKSAEDYKTLKTLAVALFNLTAKTKSENVQAVRSDIATLLGL